MSTLLVLNDGRTSRVLDLFVRRTSKHTVGTALTSCPLAKTVVEHRCSFARWHTSLVSCCTS